MTGGSRGLGRNTAVSIARHGGDVVLTCRSRKVDADAVVVEIEAMGRIHEVEEENWGVFGKPADLAAMPAGAPDALAI
ncbi:hypothetical protein [Sphingomonas sp.]|uniref:hypothetical protein n=1 Tax=Sphingomonas sp. TaxID=28214 RepID=UPI003B006EB9